MTTPRLSPSIAHKGLSECWLSAWSAHRLLGGVKSPPREGNEWHAAILDKGKGIEVLDFDAWRSNDAKEAKAKSIHDGKIPITAPKWEKMEKAVEHIEQQLADAGIVFDGKTEERIEWDEFTTEGKPVACSGYIDHLKGLHIDDLKTGDVCVTPHMASLLIARSHSILQDRAYRSAIATRYSADIERIKMRFVFVQTKEPFCVTLVELSGEFQELSYIRWQRAIDDWAKYLALGTDRKHWPGPVEGCATVHPPGWMMAQELELEALRS